MKLDKAIETLNYLIAISSHIPNPDHRDAIKLGVEALKRIEYLRKDMDCPHWMTLPGED